jgi:hypothetical protein
MVSDRTCKFVFLSHVRFEETVYSLGFCYLAGLWLSAVYEIPLFMASGAGSSYRKVVKPHSGERGIFFFSPGGILVL